MRSPQRDYSETLFLPQTDFPMRAGLPQKEPEILARWEKAGLYKQLRQAAKGREKFILHDGPPYANGNIHIGHALNKILKDVVTRSQQMLGRDSNYVPGWDCHGLPIEWKIEEENYRSKNKPKPDLSNPAALVEFRQECRAFAQHWIDVQRTEFKRLGVEGDWAHPYTTMDFFAEAQIARELMKFAANGTLVSRQQAGDVERGGEDRAGGSGGGVRGLHQRYGVGEVSGSGSNAEEPSRGRKDVRIVSDNALGRCLDDDAMDTFPDNRAILVLVLKLNYAVTLQEVVRSCPPENWDEDLIDTLEASWRSSARATFDLCRQAVTSFMKDRSLRTILRSEIG